MDSHLAGISRVIQLALAPVFLFLLKPSQRRSMALNTRLGLFGDRR